MASMTIKNCIISRKTSRAVVTNIEADIYCKEVYSICPGTVSYVGKYGSHNIVIVQYTTNVCFQYKNLESASVKQGQQVDCLTLLGIADRYVKFAYLTGTENNYPCRVGTQTYYKQKPLDVILYGYGDDYIYGDGIGHPWDDDDTSRAPETFDTVTTVQVDVPRIEEQSISDVLVEEQLTPIVETQEVSIEYKTAYITPYIVMIDSDHSMNYKNAAKNGVFGCIFEAGKLWDAHHIRQESFRNPNLAKQITGCLEAGMQFGLYLKTYAKTEFEAREELYQLSFILAKYPPVLGMWINIMSYSKSNKDRNNKLIDVYKTRLWESGLKENIGLYAKENIYDIIDWKDKSKDWLLWVYKPVSAISDLDNKVTPEFFKV